MKTRIPDIDINSVYVYVTLEAMSYMSMYNIYIYTCKESFHLVLSISFDFRHLDINNLTL